MNKISAIIITYNEERNIERSIRSLSKVADEVIVVDSFSKDKTVSIAEGLGARVFQHAFDGYGPQKKFAAAQAQYPWLLNIDADEAISPELEKSILAVKEKADCNAYKFNILPNYCGAWIRHCGWYPAPKVRLWNAALVSMNDNKVHEELSYKNPGEPIGYLKGDLLHYSFHTISDHIRKIEHYSEIGARFDVERGKKVSLLKLLIAPKWEFLRQYIFQGGILDGYYGYVVCKNSAYASFVKYIKIRQYTALKQQGLSY